MMASAEEHLPILEVTNINIADMWPVLKDAMQKSSFIAIDIEMTGLGDRKKLFTPEVDMRYKYMTELARSHATVSMGISCYAYRKPTEAAEGPLRYHYQVQTFDVLVLMQSGFTVQAESLKFLRNHGFDFNKQFDYGLPYFPGNDIPEEKTPKKSKSKSANLKKIKKKEEEFSARLIFSTLVAASKPLVLHNGLVDLTFLYQHFYAELPKKLESFAADLNDMFPMGIYDTKYFCEFVYREPATYLQFVYVRELLENERARGSTSSSIRTSNRGHVSIKFVEPWDVSGVRTLRYFRYRRVLQEPTLPQQDSHDTLCNSYAYHGWCNNGDSCSGSHNVRRIVEELHSKDATRQDRDSKAGVCLFNTTATKATIQSVLAQDDKYNTVNNKRAKITEKLINDMNMDVVVNCEDTDNTSLNTVHIPVERIAVSSEAIVDNVDLYNINADLNTVKAMDVATTEKQEKGCNESADNVSTGDVKTALNLEDRMVVDVISGPVSNGINNSNLTKQDHCIRDLGDSAKALEVVNLETKAYPENNYDKALHGNQNSLPKSESCRIADFTGVKEERQSVGIEDNSVLKNGRLNEQLLVNGNFSNIKEHCDITSIGTACSNVVEYSSLESKEVDSVNGKGLKRERSGVKQETMNSGNTSACEGHSAGFDAYMTGFIFASYISQQNKLITSDSFSSEAISLTEHVDKVYLMGKNFPFLVRRTAFSKLSKNHTDKIQTLRVLP
uniref:Target of EGR1 protein 1-like n=1 Tax=Hirondellea gigas TaxID=1518452 RepID=A0A2P2I067_9CRUS